MSINPNKTLLGLTFKGDSVPLSQPTAKGLADGTLTSFSAPDLGVTSLAYRRFYQMTNLQTLDLTGVTSIPEYTAYQCTGLTSLILDPNITMVGANAFNECSNTSALTVEINGAVGDYAFRGVNIGVLKGVLTNTGQEAFRRVLSGYDTSNLSEIDIKVNGSIGNYLFTDSKNVSIFKLDPTSNITSLGVSYSGSAFSDFGSRRQNPSQNVFKFDLRNSTFTSVGQNTFRGYSFNIDRNKYFDIWLPSSLTTLYAGAFADTDYFNIYYKNIPSLSSTNVFNTATNYKNFFPYNLVQTARTSTNWSSSSEGIVSSIYGYAEENTFSQGDMLPVTDADGYELTWYSDAALTNQVTTVTDPTQIYYCAVGAQVATPLTILEYQATVAVSDGTNTYVSGQCVPYNSTITITAIGQGVNTTPYIFTFNGTAISSGYTYTVTSSDTLLDIQCMYYDGVNPPIDSTFANNSWGQIAAAIQFGLHRTLWPISAGSTVSKPITLKDGTTMGMRLSDGTANRYQYSDGSGYSQAVLEMTACIPTKYYMNSSNTNSGGWPATYMCNTVMPLVYNDLLPDDLKAVIRQVKRGSATSYSSSTMTYANNYCFLLSVSEISNSYSGMAYDEGPIYQYYDNIATSARIKQLDGTDTSWWLVSPQKSSASTGSRRFCYCDNTGSIAIADASSVLGVSVCVAI